MASAKVTAKVTVHITDEDIQRFSKEYTEGKINKEELIQKLREVAIVTYE